MCAIRVGGEQAEFLAITLLGRSHPACTDYWDGNWLQAEVDVAAGGFRGNVFGDLRAEELADFHRQLSRLLKSLEGQASFSTMERWLAIEVTGDGLGHMTFDGEIRDVPGIGNTLKFKIQTDQTFVRPMVDALGIAVNDFPIIGRWCV